MNLQSDFQSDCRALGIEQELKTVDKESDNYWYPPKVASWNLKRAIKAVIPKTAKVSVRMSSNAGNAIYIEIQGWDGINDRTKFMIQTWIPQFKFGYFNGQIDLYEYKKGIQAYGAAHHVFLGDGHRTLFC